MKDFEKMIIELKKYWEKNNIPNISLVNARFLRDLIKIKKPKKVLEIWTANWFSSICFALELKKIWWKLTTIEFSEFSYNEALKNFLDFEVQDIIYPILWNAIDIIPKLKDKYDFLFIDWMKRRTKDFLELSWEKVEKNWIIIIDDVIKFWDKMIWLWEYLKDKNIVYNLIPIDIDDGIVMIVKD